MAEDNVSDDERTEMPTDRRMGQLRKDGQLHLSTDVTQVAGLLAGFLSLYVVWQWILDKFMLVMVRSFQLIASPEPLTIHFVQSGAVGVAWHLIPPVLCITAAVAGLASLSVMLQTNWNVKEKKIQFKFSSLNPITGIKKVFSIQSVMQTLKAIAKLCIILPIAYYALEAFAPQMIGLMHTTVEDILVFTGASIWSLFWKILYVLIVLAIFDYFWTHFQWLKKNRMTKNEIKDERKSMEGDEGTKRRIQAKGLQRIAQRIRESVPQADVVVTNPTHYAVALKYDRENMDAPVVVAKGRGFLALRIRELAKESGVPVLERKWLARSLYASVEIGKAIPADLFRAVAEVLAYVYKLKGKVVRPAVSKSSQR